MEDQSLRESGEWTSVPKCVWPPICDEQEDDPAGPPISSNVTLTDAVEGEH